jgi:copper chaperone CopZ
MSRDPLDILVAVMVAAVLVLGGTWAVRHFRQAPTAESYRPSAQSGQRRVTLEVSGMLCEGCASRVTRELQAVPGVGECLVDIDHEQATVVCDKDVADSALVHAAARADKEFAVRVAGH